MQTFFQQKKNAPSIYDFLRNLLGMACDVQHITGNEFNFLYATVRYFYVHHDT